jgi:hypothetical protein
VAVVQELAVAQAAQAVAVIVAWQEQSIQAVAAVQRRQAVQEK